MVGLAVAAGRYGEFMPADREDARDKPVVLSRIYTRTGDGGTTALGDGSRVGKDDPRLAAYADVDEANCAIGTALALGQLDPGLVALLTRIQNEMFDVGADLCNPISSDPKYPPLRVDESYVRDLERACDEHNESDLLFILARRANASHGDVLWQPGGER